MIRHRQTNNATTNDDHVTRLCHSIPVPDAISSVTVLGRCYYTMPQCPGDGRVSWVAIEICQPAGLARAAMAVRAGLPLTSTTTVSPATPGSVVPPKLPSLAASTEPVAPLVVLSKLTVLLAGTAPALPVTITPPSPLSSACMRLGSGGGGMRPAATARITIESRLSMMPSALTSPAGAKCIAGGSPTSASRSNLASTALTTWSLLMSPSNTGGGSTTLVFTWNTHWPGTLMLEPLCRMAAMPGMSDPVTVEKLTLSPASNPAAADVPAPPTGIKPATPPSASPASHCIPLSR